MAKPQLPARMRAQAAAGEGSYTKTALISCNLFVYNSDAGWAVSDGSRSAILAHIATHQSSSRRVCAALAWFCDIKGYLDRRAFKRRSLKRLQVCLTPWFPRGRNYYPAAASPSAIVLPTHARPLPTACSWAEDPSHGTRRGNPGRPRSGAVVCLPLGTHFSSSLCPTRP